MHAWGRHAHTGAAANYAVNLRVCTRTRNNAGNLERLHGSRGNVQRVHQAPAGVGVHAGASGRIMWRSAWFMRAVRAKNAGTSVVYIGRRRKRSSKPMVTSEREKREKEREREKEGEREGAYVHGRRGRTGEEHLRVCAPVPRS